MAKLPVRNLDGQWQVLIYSPEKWHDCESESDAEIISRADELANQVQEGAYDSKDLAKTAVEQLEKMEKVVDRNFGNSMFLRHVQSALSKARKQLANPPAS